MLLHGLHHVTAISARIRENHDFYTRAMGMRLVKRSVNQDDTSAYHLFYADGKASPGTDFTFFDWPMQGERRGTHSIIQTQLRVAGLAALEWWAKHLKSKNISSGAIAERGGRLTLDFEDPEGQRLALVDDEGKGQAHPWSRSPVPTAHQVRGLGPIVLSVPELAPTDAILQKAMGMRSVREYRHRESPKDSVHVYEMGSGGPGAEVHVAVQPDLTPARQGAGAVHHVAFRVATFEEHAEWIEHLTSLGVANTGLVDRYYFRSCYFREPNGILFELATDGPGFAVDEDENHLGEKVALPPFLEPRRVSIVARLKPID